jgi:hypothetical protein
MSKVATRLRRLPDEFTLQQWIRRPSKLARRVLVCDCWRGAAFPNWTTSLGFRCRGRDSCGRYCCACVGGSGFGTENLCAACANKRERGAT